MCVCDGEVCAREMVCVASVRVCVDVCVRACVRGLEFRSGPKKQAQPVYK